MTRLAFVTIAILAALPVQARADDPLREAEAALMRFIASQEPARAPTFVWGQDGFEVHDGPPLFFEDLSSSRVLSAPVVTTDQVHIITGRGGKNDSSDGSADGLRNYSVLTKREGEWAVQLCIPFRNSDRHSDSIESAKSTIDRFFTAWNAADNDAIHEQINFPHAFLVREGRASIANSPAELITDFDAMREREGWARSDYSGFEVIHADVSKVIAKLTFTRHHADGTVYRTVPVVWIFTNQDGHWGLQLRLILPALEEN